MDTGFSPGAVSRHGSAARTRYSNWALLARSLPARADLSHSTLAYGLLTRNARQRFDWLSYCVLCGTLSELMRKHPRLRSRSDAELRNGRRTPNQSRGFPLGIP